MERIDEEDGLFFGDFQLIGQRLGAHAVDDPVADLLGLLPLFVGDVGRRLLPPRRGYGAEYITAGLAKDRAQTDVFTQMGQDPQFQLTVVG